MIRSPKQWFSRWLAVVSVSVAAYAPLAAAEPAAEPADNAEIQRLINQLGDTDYFVRQRAQDELEKVGFEAFDALTAATQHDDLEIASRARYLLKLMRVDMAGKNDSPEVKKLLADYESLPREQKRARMSALAELPNEAGTPALCRLVRYEKSPLLARFAAVALFNRSVDKKSPEGKAAVAARAELERCPRPPARWLLTWLGFGDDANAALAEWAKHVDAEAKLLDATPNDTAAEIVAGMIRCQIAWLKRQNANEQALAAMERLIDLEEGDPEMLVELMQWFIDQKAWKLIEKLEDRFKPQFKDNAVLMYALAQAKAEQDDKPAAEKLAETALKLSPGKELEALLEHLRTAIQLRQFGLHEWAAREYRHVIANALAGHPIGINARFGLAEMFHDQGNDLDAAQLLEEALKATTKKVQAEGVLAGRSTDEIVSRMHYFFACHDETRKEAASQKEHIVKGVAVESPDVDLLIHAKHFSDLSEEQRQSIDTKIRRIAMEFQQQINGEPNNALHYNQYAWLVGNTSTETAELDQALKYSKRSLELSPNNGGYLDTLAHVYAAKGDYENAVRYQTLAAEREPHAGQIARKLKLFQAKLTEKKKDS